MTISSGQRFTKDAPCPVCNGHPGLPSGKGIACKGFLSSDGAYAHCTREEYAGEIQPHSNTLPRTFPHRLKGSCNCGREHGAALTLLPMPNQRGAFSDWTAVLPVPESAPSATFWRQDKRPVLMKWEYRDARGRLLYYRARLPKADGGKEVQPYSFCEHVDGRRQWQWKAPPSGQRQIYNQDALATYPELPVLVNEGEKSADAAGKHISGYVSITWDGGADGVKHADWSPVAGRRLVVWPDADQPEKGYPLGKGLHAAREAAARALSAGALEVRIVELPIGLADHYPGWDLADLVDESKTPKWLTLEMVRILIEDAPVFTLTEEGGAIDTAPVGRSAEPTADLPAQPSRRRTTAQAKDTFGLDLLRSRFRIGAWGVGEMTGGDASGRPRIKTLIPRPIWPAALGFDVTTGTDMIKLAWLATDGQERTQWVRAGITGDRMGLYALADRGAPVTIKNVANVAEWLCEAGGCVVPERRRVVVASAPGWADVPERGRVFVWPGTDGVEFIGEALPQSGTPAAWAEGLRLLVELGADGYLALAAVGLSAAAPVVRRVGRRRPILGVAYKTSQGKTSILNLALSVWARPDALTIQAMNSTPRGVEEAAIRVPDLPVLLDDFQEPATADPKKAGHALYFLGNGQQRTTARKDGGASGGKPRFGVAFYASEFSIAGSMHGGADRRVVELTSRPLPEGCDELSDKLKAIAAQNGGAIAGRLLEVLGTRAADLAENAERGRRALRDACPNLKGDDALTASLAGLGLDLLSEAIGLNLPSAEVSAWLAAEAAAVRDERPDQSEEAFAILMRVVDAAEWNGGRAVQGGFELAYLTDTCEGPALDVNPAHEAIRRALEPFGGEKRHRAAWADRGLIARDGRDLLAQKKVDGQRLRVLRISREVCKWFGMRAVPTG